MKLLRLMTAVMALTLTLGATAAQKSDEFKTPSGKTVKITHIKHATMMIEYDGNVFYVDPVIDAVLPATDFTIMPKANFILVTHEHQDHFDNMALNVLRTNATVVYSNQAVHAMYKQTYTMHNGDSLSIKPDIQVLAVPAYNTTAGREKFHPQGRDNGYILVLDGLRIYIAGDTEDIPEMANLGKVDIAFLPCNQPYTMTIEQLLKAANTIKPKVLFPYHYSNTPINTVMLRLSGSGIDVRVRDYK